MSSAKTPRHRSHFLFPRDSVVAGFLLDLALVTSVKGCRIFCFFCFLLVAHFQDEGN